MACHELDSTPNFTSFDLEVLDILSAENLAVSDDCLSSQSSTGNIPAPPPLPGASVDPKKCSKVSNSQSFVVDATREAWDKLFLQGYQADVRIIAEDKSIILAHSCVLGNSSPVLRSMLEKAIISGGFRIINITGVPSEAARVFIRFLYSSCYEADTMKKFVLHILVMSHAYLVPCLKLACIELIERELLTTENVADVLQLARQCDAPRLSLVCMRMIIRDFKTISGSEGWKIMKLSEPSLERDVLESLVEEDTKKRDRLKRIEERKVYKQLHEAMEALVHICRDGCRTIGPRSQATNGSETACKYKACKGLESVLRHFSGCRLRVSGGCAQCKSMWQLLELHSVMCFEPNLCKVPLCRHFKDKLQSLSKKDDRKWMVLASKVTAAKGTISSIAARKGLVSYLKE